MSSRKIVFAGLVLFSASMPQLAGPAAGRDQPLANHDKAGLYIRSLEHVLRLDAEEVDLGTAALIISERWEDVRGRRYLAALDEMALEIRSSCGRPMLRAPRATVAAVNKYLFDELAFEPVEEADDPNDLFLHSVLDNKRGHCLSLSILYLAIGERLGLPVYGVVVPGHFFVRYDDGRNRFNIETTSAGRSAPDEHYLAKFKVPAGDSIYMTNLDKLQTLGCFFNNLGNAYSEVGESESALRSLETAVRINPSLAESRSNLGNLYLESSRPDEAIVQYNAALAINPAQALIYSNLGNAYARKGWSSDAIGAYLKALELDPVLVAAMNNLGNAYFARKRYDAAMEQYRRALELAPDDETARCNLAAAYSNKGLYEEAAGEYTLALRIEPQLARAHKGLVYAMYRLGRCRQALEHAAIASELGEEPDSELLAALKEECGND